MSVKKTVTNTMVAGAVALALSAFGSDDANAEATAKEKCYGVVKAGHNDCGNSTKTHSCMGHAAVDGDGTEWIALPKGICEKLAGGSLTPVEGDAKAAGCESKDGCDAKAGCEGKNSCEGHEDKEG